ncbi:MAG: GAF domain-containing protein [Pseudomonadota bacterium]|nr:GAF domain-containing protein [Pseudomonadota bacterium]
MQTYKVSGNGVQVSVESDNWLFAVALSLPQLGLDPSTLDQLVCSMAPDGSVAVVDATNRVPVRIAVEAEDLSITLDIPGTLPEAATEPVASTELDPVTAPEAATEPEPAATEPEAPTEPEAATLVEPGAPTQPAAPKPARRRPHARRIMETGPVRLAEAMERRQEIEAAVDADSACDVALRIVTDLVEAESGAVLQRLYQTRSLSFVAAVGPRAHRVLGTTLPGTTGIAGFSFTSGFGVIVQDVDTDGRFTSTVDSVSGYRTRSVLAMPIRVVNGPIFGCLELLNAPEGFGAADLEIVRVVALALGHRLRVASE